MIPFLYDIQKWQKKPAERRKAKVFIVEGIRMFTEAPKERMRAVVFNKSFYADHESLCKGYEALKEIPVYIVPDGDFERISDTKTPQGVLAVLNAFSYGEEQVLSDPKGVYMLLENLQDPGNLGTVLRSAEASGVCGVILDENSCDIYNPKVIRSTMGSVFRVPFAVVPDLKETVRKIKSMGGHVYAAHLQGSVPYDTPDYRGLSAFIIGNEAAGLTQDITAEAGEAVRIPMAGKVESLNAAMAATLLMYEAARQRK